ncbi:hypothetical protein Psi01_36840 [Planobispora siamensis]|uniref:ANTAR domain-containing protein n=1 Tax=Planobispora siamensis TaxID=936338 RepID=A0A8J3SIX8_9ACTN|nr:hypothetical protein Psi01_36840 [Planobispora siamensis]
METSGLETPDDTPAGALSALTLQAASVAGVCGASATVLHAGNDPLLVASYPELGEIAELELELHEGPTWDALAHDAPLHVADALRESRWPGFCEAMTRRGVRSCVAAVASLQGTTTAVTLYGLRPGVPGPAHGALATAFARQAALLSIGFDVRDRGQRTVEELRKILASRWPIEQAKGMIMQALACDADEAFAELRRTSQNSHLKLREVARMLINRDLGQKTEERVRPEETG